MAKNLYRISVVFKDEEKLNALYYYESDNEAIKQAKFPLGDGTKFDYVKVERIEKIPGSIMAGYKTIFEARSARRHVELDREQKNIIKRLKSVLDEAEKNGIRFIYDAEGIDCPVFALNTRNINSFDSCPEGVENGVPVKVDDLEFVTFGLYNHYEGDSLYVELDGSLYD